MRLVALLFLSSCWPVESGACDQRVIGTCLDYAGPPYRIAEMKAACHTAGRAWLDAGCPEDDRIGGCHAVEQVQNVAITTWYYPPSPYTLKELVTLCKPDGAVAP